MSELPKGWANCELQQVVDVLDSRRVPLNSDERATRIAGKPISALFPYYGATGQVGYVDDYIFDEPLVLLGEDGVPFFDLYKHKAYRVTGKTWVNNHAHVLKPIPDACDDRFLEAYLNACDYTGHVTGTTRLKLTQGAMNKISIPLAPLPEQRRIADKLDSTLARVEACRDRLDRLPALLKRFRQSILAAATSGRLTEDWRTTRSPDEAQHNPGRTALDYLAHKASTELPTGWTRTRLDAICTFQNGYAFKSEVFRETGDFQVIKLANIRDGLIRLDAAPAFIKKEDATELQRFSPESGDILISMTGTKYKQDYGFVCEVPSDIRLLVNQRVGRFIPDKDKVLGKFLLIVLRSEQFRSQFFEGETGGVNQGNVGSEHIKSCVLAVPSIQEQHEIVRRVKTLFAFADRLEARLATARKQAEQLTPPPLAKAFRGELVPQDPNDEPATELLKRLATTRSEAPKVKRGRKAAA